MFDLALPFWGTIVVFAAGALAVGIAGTKLAGLADRLADRTGLGEAVTGTLFLGFATALPGIAASVTAAASGHPSLAVSNALGGIAVQTASLAVGDIAYRRANLEHAAASAANMMQAIVLIVLLVLVLLTLSGPEATVLHVHPMTFVLYAAAAFGIVLVYRTKERPMWRPEATAHTVEDVPEPAAAHEHLPRLLAAFALAALVVLAGGVVVAKAAGDLAAATGISQLLMGGLFLAVVTSLPELVTTVAAIRRGALTLAVSDIVGGNFFDVLFVSTADLAFTSGSIYHAEGVGRPAIFLNGTAILLNSILLMGLIYRQQRGPGNIGFESVLMLAVYILGFVVLWLFF